MPPHTPHTFLYNTIIVKYKQVYSHVNSPHIFTAADMLLAHIRTFVKKKTRGSHECDHGFLFSSLSTITSCPFRRRHRLALQECPL